MIRPAPNGRSNGGTAATADAEEGEAIPGHARRAPLGAIPRCPDLPPDWRGSAFVLSPSPETLSTLTGSRCSI